MKQYPSIEKSIYRDLPIYAFDKLDGSNIRAEYNRKNGFYKFGSRNCLIDKTHETLGEAIELFEKKYQHDLGLIFRDQRYDHAVVFFEFGGLNSFAGQHVDEPHDVVLFDVAANKKGIMMPNEFVDVFKNVDTAKLLYRGKANIEFESLVKNGKLNGMTHEGVVCKGKQGKSRLVMFKIKSNDWINKLRNYCGSDEGKFRELV